MIVKELSEIRAMLTSKFFYTPLPFGSWSSRELLEMLDNIDKDAKEREEFVEMHAIDIMKYLYVHKCAPISYILRDCAPEANELKLEKYLNSLVKQRMLNCFILTDNDSQPFDENGLVFYTVDYGAVAILRWKLDDEMIENWKATDLFMSGLQVKKQLMLIDFYKYVKGLDLEYWIENQLYKSYEARLRVRGTMKISGKVFLVETATADDVLESNSDHLLEKILRYENLLATEGWKYYFATEETWNTAKVPTLIVYCDSLETIKFLAPRVGEVKIENLRYAYMDGEKLKFFKFADGALAPVKTKTFEKA